jgi:epoxyqueuosine reductase
MMDNYSLLKDFALSLGASLFGVCDFRKVAKEDFLLPEEMLADFPFAIAIGVHLSPMVLAEIKDHPTKLYFHHYKVVNYLLDTIALRIANFISDKGKRALPIPASQTIDWERQKGHLSHKRVAIAAGLGWLGRNNLLVTPEYGAQVRLVTILTDFPLVIPNSASRVSDFNCGDCYACLKVCPVGAIKERPEDFDHQKCFLLLKEFQKKHVAQYICGICVKVCPGKLSNLSGKFAGKG